MSNVLKYLMLWQQKRAELPVIDNQQTSWLEMQALLDEHMPVGQPIYSPGNLSHFAKFKLLYAVAAAIIAAAIIYAVLHHHTQTNNGKTDKIGQIKNGKNNSDNSMSIKDKQPQNNTTNDAENTGRSVIKTVPDKLINGTESNNVKAGNNNVAHGSNNNNLPEDKLSGNKHHAGTEKLINTGNKTNIHNTRTNASAYAITNAISGTGRSANSSRHNVDNGVSNKRTVFSKLPGSSSIKSQSLTGAGRGRNNRTGINNNAPDRLIQNNINQQRSRDLMELSPPQLNFNWGVNASLFNISAINNRIISNPGASQNPANKSGKTTKAKSPSTTAIDWGILAGVNAPGSFTPKNQNVNIYGSLPVDAFVGLFGTYNLNTKWGINLQTRFLVPHLASGSYSHANNSKVDTNQTLQITDSRKIYTADIPLHIVYNLTGGLSLKAGGVISIPVKQINGSSSFQTSGTRKDTTGYYKTLTNTVNTNSFEKKLDYGLSGGISLHVKRLLFDATYYRGLQTQKVSSTLGSYTNNTNGVQLTIGFKLNKSKP